jgi:hypothetical protein
MRKCLFWEASPNNASAEVQLQRTSPPLSQLLSYVASLLLRTLRACNIASYETASV